MRSKYGTFIGFCTVEIRVLPGLDECRHVAGPPLRFAQLGRSKETLKFALGNAIKNGLRRNQVRHPVAGR